MSATNEQPHALLGDVPIAGGGEIRAYATTPGGRASCVLVERLTPAGTQIDSVAYCGEEPAAHADLRLINAALIGWVPDPSVTSVRVSGAGRDRAAPVVAQHFIVAAAESDVSGTTETITGRNAGNHIVAVWSVKIR